MGLLWLILLVIFIVVEMITVGLISIWFAGGALAALISYGLGANVTIQIIVFAVVTVFMLIFTKPIVEKYFNTRREKTNYEGVIGKTVRVIERIDNVNNTGAADCAGQVWTARSVRENGIIEQGMLAKVVEIKGVKLMVEELKGE